MSKICIGVIKTHIPLEMCSFREQIKPLFNRFGLGVFFEFPYLEPFMKEYEKDDYFVFSVADNMNFDNCEMFLLPDNCTYNGKKNEISFKTRMSNLKSIIEIILKTEKSIELFIGESGTEFFEFEFENINLERFEETLNNKLNCFDAPDICLRCIKEKTGDG